MTKERLSSKGKSEMLKNYDAVIVGTGVAGLYSALNLSSDLKILLITKRELKLCNSALAQGGVAAVYKPTDDNTQLHTNDTLVAGGFHVKQIYAPFGCRLPPLPPDLLA